MDSQTGTKKPGELSAEGFKLLKKGDYEPALGFFTTAAELYLGDNDLKNHAVQLQAISEIYRLANKINEAVETCERLIRIYEQTEDYEPMFRVLNNTGLLEIGRKNYERALANFERALELSIELDNKNYEALQSGNIGSTYRDMNKSDRAIRHYEKALYLYEKSGNREGTADQCTNIAYIHVVEKRFEKALELYQKALPLYIETENADKARFTRQNMEKLETIIN
jgi:tetratricopeptide (TPR) repeat protein